MNSLIRTGCSLATGPLLGALTIGLLAIGPPAAAGKCTSAVVHEAIRLPGGESFPAGRLTLCVKRETSPVSTLHSTYFQKRPVGMLLGRRDRSEGGAEANPYMMFEREPDGMLRLYGYAVPDGDHMVTYLLQSYGERRHGGASGVADDRQVARRAPGAPLPMASRPGSTE